MSISSEISRISGNISDSLDAVANKGVTVPSGSNSDDLAGLIAQIPSGGTGAISVVDSADAAGGTVRTITALDISDTTAVASDVLNSKYFYTADGQKAQGTATGGISLADTADAAGGTIRTITAEVYYLSGTFTTPNSGSTYELSFNQSFDSYIVMIEMTDESKTALVNSGSNGARTFCLLGRYPMASINNIDNPNATLLCRFTPDTGVMGASAPTSYFTYTSSSITMPLGLVNTQERLYYGYTYRYYVAKIY